ncbi:MAG: diacylglycerol kinase family protein [Patescibacteria group bacterium]|nr:diacylglycerol kinase family protein [Patescibacteria group bacterium]
MIHRIRHRAVKHARSFGYAFEGISWALRTQPNYQIHVFLAVLSLVAGYVLGISYAEFLFILAMIFIGLAIETVNTAIEQLADAIDKNYNKHIKIAKDVAAGAMLFFSIGAAITAGIIFLPKLF